MIYTNSLSVLIDLQLAVLLNAGKDLNKVINHSALQILKAELPTPIAREMVLALALSPHAHEALNRGLAKLGGVRL